MQITWSHLINSLMAIHVMPYGNNFYVVMRGVWAVLVATLIAVLAWRGAAFTRETKLTQNWTVFALPGLALGLGLVLGRQLNLQQAGLLTPPLPTTAGEILVSVVLLAVCVAICCWTGYCARVLGSRIRTWRGLLLAAATGAMCLTTLDWTTNFVPGAFESITYTTLAPTSQLLEGYAEQVGWSPIDDLIVRAMVFPFLLNSHRELIVVALTLLWLIPLAFGTAWSRLRAELWAGLAGGTCWSIIDVLLRATAHHQIPPQIRTTDAFAVVFASWELGAAATVQFGLGLLLTLRRARLPQTLFASSTAGVLICVGLWATHLSDGCVAGLEIASARCPGAVEIALVGRPQQVLPLTGMLATTAGAVIVLSVRTLLTRHTTSDTVIPTSTSPHRSALALGYIVLIAMMLTTIWHPTAERDITLVRFAPKPGQDHTIPFVTWIYGGGMDEINNIQRAFASISAAVDLGSLRIRCLDLAHAVAHAQSFPPPPQDQARARWTNMLHDFAQGADACVRSVDTNSLDLTRTSVTSLTTGSQQTVALLNQITQVMQLLAEYP